MQRERPSPIDELTQHKKFGHTDAILNKVLTLYDNALAELSSSIELAGELNKSLSKNDEKRLLVSCDPIFRSSVHNYLRSQISKSAFEAILKSYLIFSEDESYQSPITYFECSDNKNLGSFPAHISIWNDEKQDSFYCKIFRALFEKELSAGIAKNYAVLRISNPEIVKTLRFGFDFIHRFCLDIGNDTLRHVQLIAIVDLPEMAKQAIGIRNDLCQSVSCHQLLGTIFLSPTTLINPLRTAEAMLHESFHKKLSNLVTVYNIFKPDFNTFVSPVILAYWNPDISWNSNKWSLDRALYGFHYYVHISFYYMHLKMKNLDFDSYEQGFDIDKVIETNVARSRYLGKELEKLMPEHFDSDGQELINWLNNILSKIN